MTIGYNPVGVGNLDGTNLVNAPTFVQMVAPTMAPTVAGDLHLQAGSVGVDDGNNNYCLAIDLDGLPRPGIGSTICDIGAYEQQTTIPFTFTLNYADGDAHLGWTYVGAAANYAIYGSDTPHFTVDGSTLLTTTTNTSYVDGNKSFYFYVVLPLDAEGRSLSQTWQEKGLVTFGLHPGD